MNIGASVPPDVPDPREISTTAALHDQKQYHGRQCKTRVQNIHNRFVSRAEHSWEKISGNPQPQRSDGRMQQDRNFLHVVEEFFQPFQSRGKSNRRKPADNAEKKIEGNAMNEIVIKGADVKHRLVAEQAQPHRHGQRAGEHQRNKRSRLKLEQQEFNREQRSRNRSIEHRSKTRARAASQQDFALRRRGRNNLAD